MLASIRAMPQEGLWVERLLGRRQEEPVGEIEVRSLSVSRLEEYARCPMAWFIRYGLNPSPMAQVYCRSSDDRFLYP